MAKMFPDLNDLELEDVEQKSRAEANVYRAFRDKAPPDWLVLHALNLVVQPPAAPPQDAEADFVVFAPYRGFLVIEVKGGRISRDVNGRWWSTNRHGKKKLKDPLRQALANKYQVLRHITSAPGWGPAGAPWLLAGHAAFFPDQDSVTALVGPGRPQQILGAGSELNRIGAWVDGVFQFWSSHDTSSKPLGQAGMAVARAIFCSPVTVHASLALSIVREQQRQIELTRRQSLALQTLRHTARAAIAGAAGTGKTLLALQHAQALAAQGRRTLLVCYSRALADFLKREATGIANLDVMQFHQLCDWRVGFVNQAKGIDLMATAARERPGVDEFDVQKPYALALSTAHDPSFRYQAILVDEGQDFGDEYWLAIEMLLAHEEDAQLYVFYDPNQAIYQLAKDLSNLGLGLERPLLLTENCRSTRPLHTAAYRYYRGYEVAAPELDGAPITELVSDGLKAQAKTIQATVSDLLQKGGLRSEDIAVLLAGEFKDAHFRALHDGGAPQGARWSFERLWQPGCVLVDTVRRFKGLEAAAVILWCPEDVDVAIERELFYVALSRARNRLWVVGSAARVKKVLHEDGPH